MRKVFLGLLLSVCFALALGQWQPVSFSGRDVECMANHPQDTSTMLVAVVDSLFHSSDGGYTWSLLTHFNGLPINCMMYDPIYYDTVYALLGDGTYSDGIYRSTDGGYTWAVLEWLYYPRDMLITDPGPMRIMIVGCDGPGVYKTEDDGNTWIVWNTGLIDSHVHAIDYCAPFDTFPIFYAGTSQGLFSRSSNMWTQANGIAVNVRVSSIAHMKDSDLGFATVGCGSWSDGIYRSLDFGQTWQVVDWWIYSSSVVINPLWQNYPNDTCGIFAGDSGLGVKYSSDCGTTWQQVNSGLSNLYINMLSYHPQDSMRLFAATQGGLFRYDYQPGIVEHGAVGVKKGFSISRNILRVNEPIRIRIDDKCVVEIYDATGRAVRRERLSEEATYILPIERTGIYYVSLSDGRNSYREKIIVIE